MTLAPVMAVKKYQNRLRIGLICSTNGGAFRAAYRTLAGLPEILCEWVVVTDRPCGVETFCEQEKIACHRIQTKDREMFSHEAAAWFADIGGVDAGLLFFDRLITESLFLRFPMINIHPSLLPAFPGIRSLERAFRVGVRYLGATAHLVDAGVDTGPIIAQTCHPVSPQTTYRQFEKISFLQKAHLGLLVVELLSNGCLTFGEDNRSCRYSVHLPTSSKCNPDLSSAKLRSSFDRLCKAEWLEVAA